MNKVNKMVPYIAGIWFVSALTLANRDFSLNGSLRLRDGRKIVLKHVGDKTCWELSLRTPGNQYLWDRTYCTDFDLLWWDPFFIPIKADAYEIDLNHDGKPEVALAVWDGGNSPAPRWALIFTVEEKSLQPFGRRKYDIESQSPLLP